jgi:hypothetical protein
MRTRIAAAASMAILAGLAARLAAQTPPDPCGPLANPPDASLQISLKDGQATFREGEIVGVGLAFTSSATGKYQLNTRNYDRSGRLDIDRFCVEPAGRDPVKDFFIGGFAGGGIGGYSPLSISPYNVAAELNEWIALAPGSYRLHVVSYRAERAATKDEAGSGSRTVPLVSNVITLQVVPATPDWQAAQLTAAIAAIDSGAGDAAKHGARILRFLGSEASTGELARRFWALNDQPLGWEFMFGLFGSPFRQVAINAMKAAIADPTHPVSSDFIRMLARLEIQSNPDYALPPFDPAKRDEWTRIYQRQAAAQQQAIARHYEELAAAMDKKTGTAHAVSVDALLEAPADVTMDRTKQRQTLAESWDGLSVRTRNELLSSRWETTGGPELLPVLRRIVNGPPGIPRRSDQVDRGAALRDLYQLSPDEGRAIVLREINDVKGDIGIDVLGMLPDRELPEIEPALIARLQSNRGTSDMDFQLLRRYATARPLADVQRVYESRRGRWACAPQTAMLRYFLRVDPSYGTAEVKSALTARQSTGCYHMLLSDLRDDVARPEIERTAIAALDDPAPEVVANAAQALGRYGSTAAEEPLWRRMTAFHETWKDRADELRSGPGLLSPHAADSLVEYELINAIARGQGWLCGPEKLARLKGLVSSSRQIEVDSRVSEWQRVPFGLSISWRSDGTVFYSAAGYNGDSVDVLIRKLKQFPAGASFVWNITPVEQARHRTETDAVIAAAKAAGLVLQIR